MYLKGFVLRMVDDDDDYDYDYGDDDDDDNDNYVNVWILH